MPSPFVHRAFDVLGLGLKLFEGNYIIVFDFCSIICNKDFGKSEFCYPVFSVQRVLYGHSKRYNGVQG